MNERITIGEAIALVDEFKPNVRTEKEKKRWLNDLDFSIKTDIIDTHKDSELYPFEGYDENSSSDTPLLVPAQFGRDLYRFYLEAQIDLVNKETNRYNESAAVFQTQLDRFALYWHNHHLPLQKNSIHF